MIDSQMLEAVNLTKNYQSFTALNSLNLTVNAGDIFCLLGANGAGKTTTINLFLGFVAPSQGQAIIKGLPVKEHLLETKKYITYIPENLMLYPNLTGLENLEYFSVLSGKKHEKGKLEAHLVDAGLQADAINRRVSVYSKGMRQKVGIALALARESDILLLDEPTSGLDPQAGNEFSELLLQLQTKKVATLMATHDIFRAHATGTHIGIMKAGRLEHQLRTTDSSLADLEKLYLDTMKLN